MKRKHLPNLFIIGAMKSGTSSLHACLGTHPDIFMCEPKEPGFFVEQLNWRRGLEWYARLFENAGDRSLRGESSTEYTKAPMYDGVPERIASCCGDARFIYVMRDPIERTISHYWHMVRWHSERRTLRDAVLRDPQYRQVSHYAGQLRPYFKLFGGERLLTLTFEEFTSDPRATVKKCLRWLGCDDAFVPPNVECCENSTPQVVERVRGYGLLHRFRYSTFWNAVGRTVPQPIRKFGLRLSASQVRRGTEDSQDVVDFLRKSQVAELTELVELLNRPFPEWRTTHGTAGGAPFEATLAVEPHAKQKSDR